MSEKKQQIIEQVRVKSGDVVQKISGEVTTQYEKYNEHIENERKNENEIIEQIRGKYGELTKKVAEANYWHEQCIEKAEKERDVALDPSVSDIG